MDRLQELVNAVTNKLPKNQVGFGIELGDEIASLKDKLKDKQEFIRQLKEMRDKLSKDIDQLKQTITQRNTQIADLRGRLLTTEGIYEGLKASSELNRERMKNIYLTILHKLEILRSKKVDSTDPAEYIIRLCQAEVAEIAGYKTRADWERNI